MDARGRATQQQLPREGEHSASVRTELVEVRTDTVTTARALASYTGTFRFKNPNCSPIFFSNISSTYGWK